MPQIRMLADGVRLVAVPANQFKTGCISVSMALPMNGNLAANSLLVYLLKRSCKEYPDFTLLNGKLDELYGASIGAGVLKLGESQVLYLSITSLDDKFALTDESISEQCANLLADLIFKPNIKNKSFGKEALATEKRLLMQRIEEELNDKRTYAFNKCIEHMCSNESYGRDKYGTVEEIENITMNDIYEAWKNLLSTAVFQITAVGSADVDTVANAFIKHFEKIERNPVKPETVFVAKSRRFNRYEEKFPVNQGKLVIGFRAGTHSSRENLGVMTVMNDIFGSGTYSKLFTNVREKLSHAYYCWSKFIKDKGLLLVEAGIDTDKEKKVSAEVLSQLSDLRNGKTDPEILESSKRALKERYTFSMPESILSWYSTQVLEDEILTTDDIIKSVEQVTMEQVCEAAKKLSIDTIFMLSAQSEGEADCNEN
ncbi:MAG: insulinase family protein [Clostridia bacterium]|nr:insulinase family protein [Clostridia bacterium]